MAEHNLDDYTEFKDTTKKFTKVDIILLFSFFSLISFLFFKFVNNSNIIDSNLKILNHNFTKIENNKLIILNKNLDLNKNLYILELYRFGQDSCNLTPYNKKEFLLGSTIKTISQLQEHVIYFNNDIYINNLFKKQLKDDVIISINNCLQTINSNIDNLDKIDNSWK